MHFLRICVSVLAALSVIIVAIFTITDLSRKNQPVIKCDSGEILEVPTKISDQELLEYVTAFDEEDGDLTENIIVERQNYFLEKGLTTVNFAVCDSDNNTVKLKKKIKFSDYNSPQIKLLDDLLISTSETIDFKNVASAVDRYDGDISGKIKIISPNYNNLKPGEYDINLKAGEYDVNFKVTNSFSDTCDITVKAIVTDEDYSAASIKLSDYLIYTKIGETVNFRDYIKGVVGADGQNYSVSQIVIDDSEFDPEKAGTYNVFFSIKSGSSTVTKTRMIVVVDGGGN